MVRMQLLYILEITLKSAEVNGETVYTILLGEQKYGACNGRKYYNIERVYACYNNNNNNNNIIEIINNKNQ